jgi:ubiquinone/menaquinone biosynthesis C-methylase UbiE
MNMPENQEKLSYAEKMMGFKDTIFANYRTKYLQEFITNKGLLLDVGCGVGWKIQSINKSFDNLETIGLDISQAALAFAKMNNAKAHFVRGDAEKLPIRSKFVDYIVSFDLLEHLPNPKEAVCEFHRIFKKDGILHCFVPCDDERLLIVCRSGIFRSLTKKHAGHIQHFTKHQIRCILEEAGFVVIDEKHSYFHLAQLVHLLGYMLSNLSRTKPEKTESFFLRLTRSFLRVLISSTDLKLSNKFPKHSMGYHVTARKD